MSADAGLASWLRLTLAPGLGAAKIRDLLTRYGLPEQVLSAPRREELYEAIRREAVAVAVSWAHAAVIDRENILRATLSAMGRAVARLKVRGLVVVDGNRAIGDVAGTIEEALAQVGARS